GRQLREIAGLDGEGQSHGRVDVRVRTAAGDGGEDARHHREGPSGGDGQPARAFGLAALEQHVGNRAVAHENEDHRPHEFTEKVGCHWLLVCNWCGKKQLAERSACPTVTASRTTGRRLSSKTRTIPGPGRIPFAGSRNG